MTSPPGDSRQSAVGSLRLAVGSQRSAVSGKPSPARDNNMVAPDANPGKNDNGSIWKSR